MTKQSKCAGPRWSGRGPAAAIAAIVLLGLGAGCVPPPSSTPSSPAPSAAGTSESGTAAPSISAGPVPEPSPAAKSPGPSVADLRTRESVVSGRSGTVSWRVRVPEFSGAPAATEVNARVGAAVAGLIRRAKREGRDDGGTRRRLEGEGTVVTNDGRTAQVMITYTDYLDGTAHPSHYVTTTVVDVARRKPIVLEQVFTDPTAAYRKLEPAILRAAAEQASGIDRAGLAPEKGNWANWQTNQTGMIFVFGDYQLGSYGLREYAVPWSSVESLLTGYARRVLGPQ